MFGDVVELVEIFKLGFYKSNCLAVNRLYVCPSPFRVRSLLRSFGRRETSWSKALPVLLFRQVHCDSSTCCDISLVSKLVCA